MSLVHEVSLIENVIALVEDQRHRGDFARVRVIRLQLGALGPAEPDALRFCFDAVARGTIAEGAALEIDIIPGKGRCSACGRSVGIDERFASCPLCDSPHVQLIAGDELRLAELEVD